MRTTVFPKSSGAGIQAGALSSLPAVRARGTVPAAPRPLTKSEAADLARCEAAILSALDRMTDGLKEIGRLVQHIQEEKLWRASGFATFEEYARAKFGRSAHRLRQFSASAGVIQDLQALPPAETGGIVPTTESQARPLAPLPKEERQASWKDALAIAGPGKQPTAKEVKAAVQKRLPAPAIADSPSPIANGKEWPMRNPDGTYGLSGAEFLKFKKDKGQAVIALLQIGPEDWLSGEGYSYRTGSMVSTAVGLDQRHVYPGRPEALMAAAAATEDRHSPIYRGEESCVGKDQIAIAAKIIQWAHKLSEEAKAETRRRCVEESPPPIQVRGHERKKVSQTVLQRLSPISAKADAALAMVSELVRMLETSQDVSVKATYYGKKAEADLGQLHGALDWLVKVEQGEAAADAVQESSAQRGSYLRELDASGELKARARFSAAARARISAAAKARWVKAKHTARAGR